MHVLRWGRPCRTRFVPAFGGTAEKCLAHLRAAGIVETDKERSGHPQSEGPEVLDEQPHVDLRGGQQMAFKDGLQQRRRRLGPQQTRGGGDPAPESFTSAIR
jgi:hypothetical protein